MGDQKKVGFRYGRTIALARRLNRCQLLELSHGQAV
jgi:hypothetical protein